MRTVRDMVEDFNAGVLLDEYECNVLQWEMEQATLSRKTIVDTIEDMVHVMEIRVCELYAPVERVVVLAMCIVLAMH